MRIAGGKHGGRKIISPEGKDSRPTLQIVRRSIFDTLGQCIEGASVLDLFSGVGTLGLEALSRGARTATFVDAEERILTVLQQNVDLLGLAEQTVVLHGDAVHVARRLAGDGATYDIVFVDPPYRREQLIATLEAIEECGLLADTGTLIVECSKRTVIPARVGGLVLWRDRRFGDTSVSFYEKQKEKR